MKVTLEFVCIDGNVAKYNVQAYCKFKGAFLTTGLQNTHRCIERGCKGYTPLYKVLNNMSKKYNKGIYVVEIKNN